MKVRSIAIVIGSLEKIPEGLIKGTGRLRNKRTSKNHPDYSIINIGQNVENYPGGFVEINGHLTSSERKSDNTDENNNNTL